MSSKILNTEDLQEREQEKEAKPVSLLNLYTVT